MPSLFLNFYSGAQEFLRLIIEDIHALSEQDLVSASEWIVETIRDQTYDVHTMGFVVDGNLFDGVFERYIALDTRNINQIIRDAQVFHNREVRFSVDEGHTRYNAGCTTLHYVKGEHLCREPVNETDLDRFLRKIEAQQQTLLENSGGSFLSEEADAVISFSDFLKKLETRQMSIMSKLPFNGSSSPASSTRATIGTPENSPIEIGREALSDEVFQPQLPNPDAESCDTADEAFCDAAETFEPTAEYCENLGVDMYIQSMMNDVIQKLETAQEKCKYMQLEEALVDHDVRTAVDYFSVNERDSYMSSVENFGTSQKARLSMTVATSTDVVGKKERVPVETQTDKESSDSGEDIAAIRDCIRTILKNRSKMSTKKKISKDEDISRVTKKTHRSSKSPKCCNCSDKKKEEPKEEKKKEMIPQKKEERSKKMRSQEKRFKKLIEGNTIHQETEIEDPILTGEYSLGRPYPEEWYRKKYSVTGDQSLGEPYPDEWYRKKSSKKCVFDLKDEMDHVLPVCSDMEEPFNRKLREKWAHDGMKSVKMPLPITNLRLPERHRNVSRFDRFQRYSNEDMADEVMDMYNLVRVDSVNYKIVPRLVGSISSLHRAPKGESTAPIGTCLAVVDESDPWLNWEDHYFKVFRVMNVGNKTCKKPILEVLHSQNAYISRDMSKLPIEVPADYNIDFELMFALEDPEKDGLVVMHLKNENGDVLSTPFAFMIPKILKPYSVFVQNEEKVEKKLVLKLKKEKKEKKKESKDKKIMYYVDRMEKYVLDIVEQDRRETEDRAHMEYLKVLDEMNGHMDEELAKSTFAVPQPVIDTPPNEPAQEVQEDEDDEDDFEKVNEECEETEEPEKEEKETEESTGSDFELVSCEDDELYN